MKRVLAIMVVVAVVLTIVPMAFAATTASGTMENITWNLDSDGTLTIRGTGEMPSRSTQNQYPWYAYYASVKALVIGEGVTSVASYAFDCDYDNLEKITFSSTVNRILVASFEGCDGLKTVTIPGTIKELSLWSFASCKNLEAVILEEGVKEISVESFASCPKLKSITIPESVERIWHRAFQDCDGLKDITILNKDTILIDESMGAENNAATIPAKTVIHGYAGSTAEAYAKQYNRTFVVLDESQDTTSDLLSRLKAFFDSLIQMMKPVLSNLMNVLQGLFAGTTTQQDNTQTTTAQTQTDTGTFDISTILNGALNGITALIRSFANPSAQQA